MKVGPINIRWYHVLVFLFVVFFLGTGLVMSFPPARLLWEAFFFKMNFDSISIGDSETNNNMMV